MKPLDKKQIPQVVALAVLAVAFFAYFVVKMILPTPAAAGTQVAAVAAKPAAKAVEAAPDTAPGTLTAPAPVAGMRDPFVQGVSDQIAPATPVTPATPAPAPPVRTASLRAAGVTPLAIPSAPPLPAVGIREEGMSGLGGLPMAVRPMPVAPVTPSWTVTGVLQSGAEHVAILRSGDARRFVRQGDHVDGQFVVAVVNRDSVVLRHGSSRFTLPLGGARTAPSAPRAGSPALPGGVPDAPRPAAPTGAVPATLPDIAEGRPAAHAAPSPKKASPSAPSIARLPASARIPAAVRRGRACPTVRVAAYQGELSSPPPSLAGRGLLPSGAEAPDFSLSTLGGEVFSLSQFRGGVVVLDFWASWYAPSARSLSAMCLLQKRLGAQGLTVLAVNSWDNRDSMLAALRGGMGSTMQLYDPGVSNESIAVRLYRVPDVPTFYVIDRDGRVAGAFVGDGQGTVRDIQATLARLGLL